MRTKQKKDYTREKLALDQQLADRLNELGLTGSYADLSRKMGKNTTYFACMKNRGYGLHVGSLVFLAARLSNDIDKATCVRERAKLRTALTAVTETVHAKCRLQELELFG